MISPLRFFSGQASLNNLEDCERHSSVLDWAFDIIQHEFENTFVTAQQESFLFAYYFPYANYLLQFSAVLRSINLIPNNSFFSLVLQGD